MLKILPTLILLAFAGIVGYVIYNFIKPMIEGSRNNSALMNIARVLVFAFGAWLIWKSLSSVIH